MRVAAALTAAAIAVLATAAPASAATPRPSNAKGAAVTLGSTSVAAGGTIRFTGTGWVNESGRGQHVTIKLDDTDILGTVDASDSGAVSGSVTIPAATTAGSEHWLRFLAGSSEGDDPSRTLASPYFAVTTGSTATATATATATSTTTATTSDDTLPKTGVDADLWLAGAVALPAAGIALLLIDRRRRRVSTGS